MFERAQRRTDEVLEDQAVPSACCRYFYVEFLVELKRILLFRSGSKTFADRF
jgi:hypothetical protein